jgi:hypothetical protein
MFVLERTSASVAREYAPAESRRVGSADVPANLVAPAFRSSIELMLRRSPTFRRQCQRITNAPELTVRLQRSDRPWMRHSRARTEFTRHPSGVLLASVELRALDDDVELIAHEIEHVIEQLDEIDLAAKAARPDSGVKASTPDCRVFETTRAVRIGTIVAEEVRRAGP